MCHARHEKWQMTYHWRNGTNKYLGILEADIIKQGKMKDEIQKDYLRRSRKLLETKSLADISSTE